MVPCPAITPGSSNGWTNVAPVRSTISRAMATLSAPVLSYATTMAPDRSVRARLIAGASLGITMVAGTPNRRAASATPCAWLPEDAATTPRAPLCLGDHGDAVVRAAELERSGALKALRLDEDACSGEGVELGRRQERRAHGFRFDSFCGGLDVGEGEDRSLRIHPQRPPARSIVACPVGNGGNAST